MRLEESSRPGLGARLLVGAGGAVLAVDALWTLLARALVWAPPSVLRALGGLACGLALLGIARLGPRGTRRIRWLVGRSGLTLALTASAAVLCYTFRAELLAFWLAPIQIAAGHPIHLLGSDAPPQHVRFLTELTVAGGTLALIVAPFWVGEAWRLLSDVLGSARSRRLHPWVVVCTAAALACVTAGVWYYAPSLFSGLIIPLPLQ